MYQKVTIVGNLGKDPEMRYAPSGSPVTSFSVATNRKYTNSSGEQAQETVWFRVSAWNRLAEVCAAYLNKGAKVLVEGHLNADLSTGGPRVWQDSNGVARASFELTASTVQFLSVKPQENGDADGLYADGETEEIPF